ncbi:hypothetical protein E8E11_005738 [Didymella keratinophila]|nr:hypothetical protein E8E11_005738 [Didymella keratinophila]
MASHGKVLDLLDDRYLDLQDVVGNVEPLPTLVPYENYTQNALVYRMDTNHEIFLGLIQDFTYRRAHEVRKELWTWLVQWEVDNSPLVQQPPSPKKLRLGAKQGNALFRVPTTPRKSPALTIFERRTLDGALMLEEDMLRILIDIVQVASSLVPNFIEFLYRWIDYYEGDAKALKAALRWEIPSLWDFEYHPLLLPRDRDGESSAEGGSGQSGGEREGQARSVSASEAAELRQNSPTKKMYERPKPDLAAIELQTFYTEESERLQYREVKFGIQPPKLEEPLPPLINIPRDVKKRTKYYAACFKSRQRALYLLQEAGITMRQIDNYQKLQTPHPRETPETGDGNGLRNYEKDAKYAQAQYELKERQETKQREISISNKLAIEAQLAATHAMPDGAAGLPLIPPTPSYARKSDMAAEMMQKIKQTRAQKDDRSINTVPKPLLGLMKSKVFAGARNEPPGYGLKPLREFLANQGWTAARSYTTNDPEPNEHNNQDIQMDDESGDGEHSNRESDNGSDESDESDDGGSDKHTTVAAMPLSSPTLPRPTLPIPLSRQRSSSSSSLAASSAQLASSVDQATPPNIAAYMQNLNTEQAQRLLPLLNPQARQAASSRLQQSLIMQSPTGPSTTTQLGPSRVLLAPANRPIVQETPLHSQSPLHEASQDHHLAGRMGLGQPTSPTPSSAGGSLMLPKQRTSAPAQYGSHVFPSQQSTASGLLVPTPQHPITHAQVPAFVSPSFDPQVFMRLRRQQEVANLVTSTGGLSQPIASTTTVAQLVREPSLGVATEPSQQTPAQRQRMLSATFNASAAVTQTHSQADTLPRVLPESASVAPSSTASAQLPNSGTMFSPPGPGIACNAPSPLSLSPPKPSPFNTMAPQILATSPFLAALVDSGTPIQIYLPKIVVPGNGIGPGGTRMGDSGCIETDALMLGHEDPRNGNIVLTKAILLSVGVWENTLRKVRNGRWSVLETYACPSSQPAKGKGKRRVDEESQGCHKAVYNKLAQASRMMSSAPAARENELTKRWRTSRGPMTSSDRGAVWEGWGVYVSRAIEMSAEERKDAMKNEAQTAPEVEEGGDDEFGPYSEPNETLRRRKEMEELMHEDEDEDEDEEMDD